MKKNKKILVSLLSFFTIICYTYFSSNNIEIEKNSESKALNNSSNLNIEYIDVGQADSILVSNNNEYMLIDAGNNEDGNKLVKYFKEKNINKFKYVIGTHAHEDHIGGMDNIINNFKVDTFYMPDCITTTKTFEDVLDSLEDKNVAFETPKINDTYYLGNATFTILYEGIDNEDLNNTSIVLKLVYKNNSFLFTGDATNITEKKILDKDLKSDVLKVGHHGSQYSTSKKFLNKVNPKYAIISVGKDNSYGHPKDVTLKRLSNISTYRTDVSGTIVLSSDGNNIIINTKKTDTNGN